MSTRPSAGPDTRARHDNNADFVRFVAAAAVVLSHAYPLAGRAAEEPIVRLSRGHTTLGILAVTAFFALSGFLITRSYVRRRDLVAFASARALRIVPGLAVVVALTVLVYGPLLTTLPLREYFTHGETARYLRVLVLWRMPFDLPGVLESVPYPRAVNGSLWTLWYEVVCYAAVAALGVLGLLRRSVLLGIVVALGVLVLTLREPSYYVILGLPFACGALWSVSAWRPRLTVGGVLVAVGLIAAAFLGGRSLPFAEGRQITLALGVAGAWLVLAFVFRPIAPLTRWATLTGGDVSYGLYIYAFPIQQALREIWPAMPIWLHVTLALPIILACAVASWRFVERPALQRVPRAAPQPTPAAASPLLEEPQPIPAAAPST